ncbi:MAG: LacI family DNA-binding transcriptional regulator [Roseburia sp.]
MTIYDISKKAGVSIATVSRVLNGSESVRPATRKKVMDVIEKYDYTPNAFARGLGLHTLNTIGILCADSSDLFLAKAVYYLEQELQSSGYESLLCCTGYNLDIRKNYMDLILSKKVDGIILVGSNFIGTSEEENQYIKDVSSQVPIMLLNAAYEYPNVYSTLCDDYSSMYEATLSMAQSGISDILYLYNSKSYSGTKKLNGYRSAMSDAGVENFNKYVHFYNGDSENLGEIAAFVEGLAKKGLSFHGVVASDDSLAIGSVKYAQKVGLKIPDEFSVIGYNNSMLTSCCNPELTSVDNRLETQTHQLVQTLIGVLSGEEMPKKSIFSGKIIKRGTTLF